MYGSKVIDLIAPFQDPYSDVSIFLARKIKELSASAESSKNWSVYLQDKLLKKITPEFGKKFPDQRLGPATLKKTWEKVSHLSGLFERQSNALTSDKKLNLHFLIRENLKTVLAQGKNSSFHPFLMAQQIAVKVGETLATYEGVRPELQHLTELTWAALKHRVPPLAEPQKNITDRWVVKWMLDVLMRWPGMGSQELQQAVQEKRKLYCSGSKEVPSLARQLCKNWTTTLLPHTAFFQTHSTEEMREMQAWVKRRMVGAIDLEQAVQDLKTASLDLHAISLYDLEILAWSCQKEVEKTPLYDEMEQEAKLHLVHHPQKHWKAAIMQAARYVADAQKMVTLATSSHWNHRIELWCSQGELVLRSLEMPNTPLLHWVRFLGLKNRSLIDPSITSVIREKYLCQYHSPLIEPSYVHQVADLMRKYGWYCFAPKNVSTFELWARLHAGSCLREKAEKEFPLIPFPQEPVAKLSA